MRHLSFPLLLLVFHFSAFSQANGIGVGTVSPHPSAAFEVNDSARGLLPPRMTFAQRNNISSPAQGLIIYCTDCDSSGQAQVYNGTRWANLLGGAALNPLPPNLPSVTIGTQTWQSKNLDVSVYRNGDPITQVTDPTQWANLATGAWCWYNNDSATFAASYGRLYNWYALADPRGLCPTGWHVPSDGEWIALENQLGGSIVAGGALKSITDWNLPNTNATNISGFTGLPGGARFSNGIFGDIWDRGYFWSSTVYIANFAWYRSLYYLDSKIYRVDDDKRNGFSVRCLRD